VAMRVQGDPVPGNNGVIYLVYLGIQSILPTDCLTSCRSSSKAWAARNRPSTL